MQHYIGILRAYQHSETDALDRLRDFSKDGARTFTGDLLALLDRAFSADSQLLQGPAALVMHCELAVLAARSGWEAIRDSQLAIIDRLTQLPALRTGESAVRARRGYLLLSVWLAIMTDDLPVVGERLRRAQAAFPNDPDLLLADASYADASTNPSAAPPKQRSGADDVTTSQDDGVLRGRSLALASQKYRHVVALQPPPITMIDARVRLARLHILEGRLDEAAQELGAVFELLPRLGSVERQQARRGEHLALMFSARLAESAADWPEAIRAYRQAAVLCPLSQAAAIGMSYAQMMAGNEAEARSVTQQLLQRASTPAAGVRPGARRDLCDGDPWETYATGQAWRIDMLMAELRAMVRR